MLCFQGDKGDKGESGVKGIKGHTGPQGEQVDTSHWSKLLLSLRNDENFKWIELFT